VRFLETLLSTLQLDPKIEESAQNSNGPLRHWGMT